MRKPKPLFHHNTFSCIWSVYDFKCYLFKNVSFVYQAACKTERWMLMFFNYPFTENAIHRRWCNRRCTGSWNPKQLITEGTLALGYQGAGAVIVQGWNWWFNTHLFIGLCRLRRLRQQGPCSAWANIFHLLILCLIYECLSASYDIKKLSVSPSTYQEVVSTIAFFPEA